MLFPGGLPPPHGHMSRAHGAASPLFSREWPALSFGATSGQTPPAASPGHLHSSWWQASDDTAMVDIFYFQTFFSDFILRASAFTATFSRSLASLNGII